MGLISRVSSRTYRVGHAKTGRSHFKVEPKTSLLKNLQQPCGIVRPIVAARYARLDPVSMSEIEGRVKHVLECYDKIDQTKLTMEAHFIKDLGLDSLDHVELVIAVENEFMLEIEDSDSETLMTTREICDHLADRFDVSNL